MNGHWTPQEDNRLLFYVGQELPESIASRLGRTRQSVITRYRREHGGSFFRATIRTGGIGVTECARILGVYPQRVNAWIAHRWLKAQRRGVLRRFVWTVDESAIEAFLYRRGGLLDGLQPAPEWASIVAHARAALLARYVNRKELGDIFSLTPQAFNVRKIKGMAAFPAPALLLQGGEHWYERAAVREWLKTAPAHYRTPRVLRAFGLEATT
jgi:hypothetical protein